MFELLPTGVWARESGIINNAQETTSDRISSGEINQVVIGEVLDSREEEEKHFRMEDGSFLAIQYGMPVHYIQENGAWADIDNTLVLQTNGTQANGPAKAPGRNPLPEYEAVNGEDTKIFAGNLSTGFLFSAQHGEAGIRFSILDGLTAPKIEDNEDDPAETAPEEAGEVTSPTMETEPESTEVPEDTATVSETTSDEETTPSSEMLPAAEDHTASEETSPAETTTEAVTESVPEETVPDTISETVAETEAPTVPETTAETEVPTATETTAATENVPETTVPEGEGVYNRDTSAVISYPNQKSSHNSSSSQLFASFSKKEPTLEEQITPPKLRTEVLYEDIFEGVDLKYLLYSYNVKETIVVKQPLAGYAFTFQLGLDGLTPELQEDGSVLLTDNSGEGCYYIPAPYMMDANMVDSDAVSYALSQDKNGNWLLTVEADREWMEAPERAFPVEIDPTLIDLTGKTKFTGTTCTENGSIASATTNIACGYHPDHGQMEVYYKFPELPKIPAGHTLVRAQAGLFQNDYRSYTDSYDGQIVLYMSQIQESASLSNVKWANRPAHNPILDFVVASVSTVDGMLYWDITPAAKTWYDDSTKNYGLAMTSNAGSSTKCRAWFSYDSQVAFIVSYRNTTGIEPYYTYQTMGAGNAGTAYIGDFSGYLTIAKNLVSYSSTVNPVSLDLVYNSSYAATYDNTNYDTGGWFGLNMHLGAGVTLSYLQQMESVKLQNDFNENNTSTYLKYTDGDGTIHYFSKDKNGVYRDEDGLGLKVTLNGGENYTVSDDNGNQMIFVNSYLVRLRDANGNEIQIRYAKKDGTTLANYYPGNRYTDYRLTQIVQKNAGGSEITAATLNYSSSGWLQTVTDAAGTEYTIHYNDDHRLTEILKDDDIIAQYGPATRIPYFYDTEAHYGVAFTYTANKISSYYEITEPSTGKQPGAIVEVDRNANGQTIYRDYGADRTKSGDDILTYYTFDYAGRSVNAYTTDANHTLYGATNAVYSGIGSTDKTNNRTVRTASIGMAAMNILQNNGTELSSPAWSFSGIVDGTNIVRKQESPRTGQYAIKGWIKKGLTQTIGAARTESLAANTTYTFSGYVNTQQCTNYAGSGVYLRVTGNGVDQKSEYLNHQTSSSVDDGWVRLSVTFTTKAAGTYTLGVYNHGAGPYFFADDFQLEQSSTPSNRNMLENGDIQLGGQCWTISQYCGFTTNIGLFSESAGARAIGLPGDAYSNRQGYQDVPVNKSGKTYVLSGWAKGVAVPDNENTKGVDPAEDLHKQFGLRAVLTYADGSTEYHYVPFNPDVTQWQFASLAIVPKKPTTVVKTIRVICAYEKNENKAYFDNLSLMEEPAQTMTYDSDGNLTSVTTTGLKSETSSYQNGNLIENVTGGNGTFTYTYDSKHNMTSVTNGVVTQTNTYDSAGNITQTKLSGSSGAYLQTSASYTNGNNLLASVTDSSGQKVSYQYGDARSLMTGLPTKILDVNGNATTTSYTDFNRLAQKVFASSGKIQYNYSNGSLTGVTRTGAGKTQNLTLGRDSFGNQTSIQVGDILLASYEYGAGNGLLKKQTYGNNASVSYTYDNLGRIQKASYSSGRNLHYTYTGNGQVYSITDDNGTSANTDDLVCYYTYDSLGRVVDSRMCQGIQTLLQSHLTYDDCSRVSSQAWQMGSQSYKESYTYSSKDGTLTGISSSGGGNSLTFTYDALERLSTVKNSLYTKSFGYKTLSGSQSTAQVEKIQYSGLKGALSSLSYSYTYDTRGNVASMTPSVGNREAYIYDAMGQLTGAALGNNYYFYNYDPTGNLMSVQAAGTTNSYTYGNGNWADLLTAYNGQAIAYEGQTVAADGSVSGSPISGNPISYYNGTRWNFSWSEGRNLTSARSTGGNGQYTYDAGGVRTGRTVTKGSTTEKHSYIYASGKLLRETITGNGTTKILDFRYDQTGAPYSLTYTVGSTSTVYYYITNLQGDVMYLADSSGSQVAAYLYDPYGKVLSSSGTMAEINPLRYRGYYQDSETGFYYLQSRYYDPAICRFINADSYASTGQGLVGYNMFAYCTNNPIIFSDPSGHIGYRSKNTYDILNGGYAGAGDGGGGGGLLELGVAAVKFIGILAGAAATAVGKAAKSAQSRYTYRVYFLADEAGVIQYVGRVTEQGYKQRMAYHAATRGLEPAYFIAGLSYLEARGLEEIAMIECHIINPDNTRNNQIHGISGRNPRGGLYLEAAINYLQNHAEDQILNLFW